MVFPTVLSHPAIDMQDMLRHCDIKYETRFGARQNAEEMPKQWNSSDVYIFSNSD